LRNPVRARIVEDPADYRFSSWGAWNGTGQHPSENSLLQHVAPCLADRAKVETIGDLQRELRIELARISASEASAVGPELDAVIANSSRGLPFHFRLDRRCRYWIDGAVIGSQAFIRETVSRSWGENAGKRRLKRAEDTASADGQIYSYRSLRKADL
jgi:hypothetical protein